MKQHSLISIADRQEIHALLMFYLSSGFQGKHESYAITPRFPKVKDEGWFLILGEVDKREMIASKRVGFVRTHHDASLSFFTPETPGR